MAYRFARELWGEREGVWAAGLLAFFLIFDVPAAVIPMASDLLMLAPHLAAVWLAWKRRAFLAGAMAGVAFWINPKGVFVAAACVLWDPAGVGVDGGGLRGGQRHRDRRTRGRGRAHPLLGSGVAMGSLYAASPFVIRRCATEWCGR